MMNDDPYNSDHVHKRFTLRESECRGAATYLCNPTSPWVVHPCNIERCRRQQVCAGPMHQCRHSKERVFALTRDGVKEYHLVDLPACMADADADFRKQLEAMRERFRKALSEEADQRWAAVVKIMKALRWNKPRWPAR